MTYDNTIWRAHNISNPACNARRWWLWLGTLGIAILLSIHPYVKAQAQPLHVKSVAGRQHTAYFSYHSLPFYPQFIRQNQAPKRQNNTYRQKPYQAPAYVESNDYATQQEEENLREIERENVAPSAFSCSCDYPLYFDN